LKVSESAALGFLNQITAKEASIGVEAPLLLEDAGFFVIQAPNGAVAGTYSGGFKDFSGRVYNLGYAELSPDIDRFVRQYDCEWR
jgi:hypothetical protein